MNLEDIKTLSDVSKEYDIPVITLKKRLELESYNMIESIDYKKLGARMPTLLSPSGVKKIIKNHRNKGGNIMKLTNLINEIMENLNFNELEKREIENGCDFKGTLDHYRSIVKDSIKEKSEYFTEEEFNISDTSIKDIIKEIQERIDNDYSCEE